MTNAVILKPAGQQAIVSLSPSKGIRGFDAFELAQRAGYTGTLEEWLARGDLTEQAQLLLDRTAAEAAAVVTPLVADATAARDAAAAAAETAAAEAATAASAAVTPLVVDATQARDAALVAAQTAAAEASAAVAPLVSDATSARDAALGAAQTAAADAAAAVTPLVADATEARDAALVAAQTAAADAAAAVAPLASDVTQARDAALAAAQTAAADALVAAQPMIEATTQQAATAAAEAVAPAAGDAIRAQVATDADRAQTAAIEAGVAAGDARSGKSPAISGGMGAYLDTSDGPRVEQVARGRRAVETYVGSERVSNLDTVDMIYDLSRFATSMRETQVDPGSDIILEQVDKPQVEILPPGRRAARSIGTGARSLLEFDTLNNALRPAYRAASPALPVGLMVMRADGSLGINGVEGVTPPLTDTFKTNAWFPEMQDAFVLTTDPAYAVRPSQMAAAGAITMRPVDGGKTLAPRLWATFYALKRRGPAELISEGPGNFVVLAYSDDPVGATGTWKECLYAVPVDPSQTRLFDSFIQNLPNGQIMLTFAGRGGGVTYGDGRMGSYGVIVQNPHDTEGRFSFSDPIDLGVGVTSQFRITAQGKLFGSHDVWRRTANYAVPWQGKWLAELQFDRLYDQQPELKLRGLLPDVPFDNQTYDECMIVQTQNGGWLAHFRTRLMGTMETRYDPVSGQWSAPAQWSAHPNPKGNGSRDSLARSPSGRLVTAFNRHNSDRTNLSVALSSDDGVTWPHYFTFPALPKDVSYPILSFDNAGRIHVVYDHGRGHAVDGIKDIVWATVNEQSIIDGNPTHTLNFVSQ